MRATLNDAAIRHPLTLGALLGAGLAWPLDGDWMRAALVAAFAIVCSAGELSNATTRQMRVLAAIGVGGLVGLAIGERLDDPLAGMVLLIGGTLALAHIAEVLRPMRRRAVEPVPLMAGVAVFALIAALVPRELAVPRALLALPPAGWMLFELGRSTRGVQATARTGLEALLANPAALLVASFVLLGVSGALALMIPAASTAPGSIAFVDALFTAVSATCVTGLAVLDTPTAFTFFGQALILGLIQLGGLGIMTFATAGAVVLGRRLGVREEAAMADLLGGGKGARKDLEHALRTVLWVTVACEALGAAALTALFAWDGDAWPMAIWRGVFTSISAFCNAGFALQSDSLIGYQHDASVLAVVSLLIVAGGLGPAVIAATPRLLRGPAPLHARLVVVTTGLLLIVPTLLVLATEWEHTLQGMSFADKLMNAWFQSVTLRTAGFNAIDMAAIQPATWTVSIVCMFIGGSPGSTAGGAKTTTIAVLMIAVLAAIRGHREAEVFGRRIPHRTVYEAAAITTVGLLLALGALLVLQLTQRIPLDQGLFEVISALATVGLSMGATAKLDDVGKLLITACMFAGRVGPLTLFIVLVGRTRPGRRYPLEAVQVG